MKITIAHLFPDLLNLYGDSGNLASLVYRMEKRGIEVLVTQYCIDDEIDYENTNIIYLGGGTEKEQITVCKALENSKDKLKSYISNGGVMLASCTGFEIMGNSFETEDAVHCGLGIINVESKRGNERFIDDVIIESEYFKKTIVGFENHISRININDHTPLGTVIHGNGNNGNDKCEGLIYKNLIGTSLHGPLLPKNPVITDWLISKALINRGESGSLADLDDSLEDQARDFMVQRFTK